MSFGEKILNYQEDIMHDLNELIKIRSVSSADKAAASQALEFILRRAEEMGFKTKNIDGIAGHAEYGEGEKLAAVLAHVDVVDAGDGWSTEPYQLTEKDGRLYGRGVVDDKGPAIIALYCLKALKDNGIVPDKRIRVIFGAAEEIGMNDMEKYFSVEEKPDMSFTPDSEYGICCCEKGILQIEVSSPTHDGTTLTSLKAGTAVNAVPSKAYALIDCTENEDHQLRRFADARQGEYDFLYTMDGLGIAATGKAAHASVPNEGLNAATHLIRILAANFGQLVLGSVCSFIDDAVGLETDGTSLGISCSDKVSGALTVNLGMIDISENNAKAYLDIRYPVTADCDEIITKISERAAYDGLVTKVINHELPLNVSEELPVINILKQAYKEITGEDAEIYSTGGGTYARTLGNRGVAFGPVFKGDPAKIHEADESISKENFLKHAQICLEAVYRLAN